ncbi:hypothetical protein [Pseudomonas sp.]|uniref:hypothetical protein n=1 Tax=Pseudomonas sp. TaxID=306 RepID=UPI0028A79156|nr:hypothetical protein [Pseudomonas sp.]
MSKEVECLVRKMEEEYGVFHGFLKNHELDLSDDYKKIIWAYFRIFSTHYEAINHLIYSGGYHTSGIVLVRTMLEIHIKSYYLEFIAKEQGDDVNEYINEEKQFPSFFQMTEKLEKVKNPKGSSFDGAFSQFTKKHMASYEKFSLFSHGKGELLKAYYEHEKMSYTTEQITDVLNTVKGMFSTIGMLLFFTQGMQKELLAFIGKIELPQPK